MFAKQGRRFSDCPHLTQVPDTAKVVGEDEVLWLVGGSLPVVRLLANPRLDARFVSHQRPHLDDPEAADGHHDPDGQADGEESQQHARDGEEYDWPAVIQHGEVGLQRRQQK